MHCTNIKEISELTSAPPRLSLIEGLPFCTIQVQFGKQFKKERLFCNHHILWKNSKQARSNIKETSKVFFMTPCHFLTEGLPSCTVQISKRHQNWLPCLRAFPWLRACHVALYKFNFATKLQCKQFKKEKPFCNHHILWKNWKQARSNIKETIKTVFMTLRHFLTEGLPSCTVQI